MEYRKCYQLQFPFSGTNYQLEVVDASTNTTVQSFPSLSNNYLNHPVISNLSANTDYLFKVTVPNVSFTSRFLAVDDPDKTKLLAVTQWGNVVWGDMNFAFDGCINMDVTATDAPTLTSTCGRMFGDCTSLVGNASFNNWNTSNITAMNEMFNGATLFNQNINNWNTANVITMRGMFGNADAFNNGGQPLATNGNSWNTANVTDMAFMFYKAKSFNQDVSSWNTANVTDMRGMFSGTDVFNNLGQPLATNGNSWNTGKVADMGFMFYNAIVFNQDISTWNTATVTDMSYMFQSTPFNQNINNWNTANVENMLGMFAYNTAFNQDISAWNTAKVTNMAGMFGLASSFNQNLGSWNLSSIVDNGGEYTGVRLMLTSSGLDCSNYSATLQGWADNSLTPSNLILGADTKTYSTEAQAARDYLTTTKGWTITDAGTCGSLSVGFGSLSAFIQNGELILNWNTVSELNNSKFIIEVSNTGIDGWKKIGEVQSKATDGNSMSPLNYTFTSPLGNVLSVLAATLLFGAFLPAFSRRKRIVLGLLALIMTVGYFSCTKTEISNVDSSKKVYVRISQVDKDGTTKILTVQEAVRK